MGIVQINVSRQIAPAPSTLQSTGAFLSMGGTNLIPGYPALAASTTGGSLATGTVYVKLTYVTAAGETPASREANVSVTGPTGEVTVTAPAGTNQTGGNAVTGYNVYAGSAAGAEVKQNTSPIAIGTNYTISTLATATGAPPTTPVTKALVTQSADLTAILAAPLTLSSLSWANGVVTATAAEPLDMTTNDTFLTTIAGATPADYNGTYLATVTGASTFTFALASNPGTETAPGTYTPGNSAELTAMGTTFFGQGASQSVYVLELGAVEVAAAITALQAYITANPSTIYSYLIPRSWDANAGFLSFVANYEATSAQTYFFVTTTTSTYSNYTALMKCVNALVEAPGIPTDEFSQAAAFWKSLSYAPSSTNKVTLLGFTYVFGVTAYPTQGNASLLASLQTANINYIGTGAEGGISNTILYKGHMLDGNDFTYWYSIDWAQITSDEDLSNAVINGSNNSVNPLYYNQDGINRLQDVEVQVMQEAIGDGLANGTITRTQLDPTTFNTNLDNGVYDGQIVVNAVPFLTYLSENPTDYAASKYGGLTVAYIPMRGFEHIVLNLLVTDFVTAA